MTSRSTRHATFVIERNFRLAPAKVFAAWSSAEAKGAWFFGPPGQWTLIKREMDFRVGGKEFVSGGFAGGPVSKFICHYNDIVPNERIVYSYEMELDDKKISVSLATIEFKQSKDGTRLVITEQGTFLDDFIDNGSREKGTQGLMDQLESALTLPSSARGRG